MLRVLKSSVQGEEDMECLNPGLVDGNVKQGAKKVHIGSEGDMKGARGKTGITKQVLKLRWPFLSS